MKRGQSNGRRLSMVLRVIGLALTVLVPEQAGAWGAEGHRVTGYLASRNLSPTTRAELKKLIGSDDLGPVAVYMDQNLDALEEQYPGSRDWHYNNRPVCEDGDDFKAYCDKGNCATKQIYEWEKVLADDHSSTKDRALAVRLLVHMIGDIHQPLHIADHEDRGGNLVFVTYADGDQDRTVKLHKFWDNVLVAMVMKDQHLASTATSKYAKSLDDEFHDSRTQWQAGRFRDWAAESTALARAHSYRTILPDACPTDFVVEKPVPIAAAYIDPAKGVVPTQLAKAGYRIAFVLNRSLDPEWSP